MRKPSLSWILITVAPLVLLACSDDPDTGTGTGGSAGSKAGAGGTAGSGGAPAGTAGSAQGGGGTGSATGGSAGTGGKAAGGSAGTGSTGGNAGTGGSVGTGGSAGAGTGGSAGAGTGGTGGASVSDSGTDASDAKAPEGGDASPTACVANTGTNPLISNMEGAKAVVSAIDGRTANDVGNLNATYTTAFEQVLDADSGTNHVLHVKGAIPGTGYLSHETGFNLTTSTLPLCYDASAYSGITFKIRGSSDSAAPNGLPADMARVYLLTKSTRPATATPPGDCKVPADAGAVTCGIPAKDIALNGTMTEVKLKWTDFAIASYNYDPGVPKADYGKTVYAIQLDVFGAGGAPTADGAVPPAVNFEYWIDDVAFLVGTD